jgi:sporulation protein YlmC with PRC-barrel domain
MMKASQVSANEMLGLPVKNFAKEHLGVIEEIVLDNDIGKVSYVVLSVGGLFGVGDKFFALPWSVLHYDKSDQCIIINERKENLQKAPGFDKEHWSDMTNQAWGQAIYEYFGTKSHWHD